MSVHYYYYKNKTSNLTNRNGLPLGSDYDNLLVDLYPIFVTQDTRQQDLSSVANSVHLDTIKENNYKAGM